MSLLKEMFALYRKNNRPHLSKEYRMLIWKANMGTCAYCGKNVDYADYEADHIYPYSKGGKTHIFNMVCSCRACNRSKGIKLWKVKYDRKQLSYPMLLVEYIGMFKMEHLL